VTGDSLVNLVGKESPEQLLECLVEILLVKWFTGALGDDVTHIARRQLGLHVLVLCLPVI
jgi:hypothetical protein